MRSHADDHLWTHPDGEASWLGTLAGRNLTTLLIEVFQPRLTDYSSSVARPNLKVFGVEPTYGQKGASTDFTCSSFDHWTAFGLNAPTGTWLKGRFLR